MAMIRAFCCLVLMAGSAAAETMSFQVGDTHIVRTAGHPGKLEATTTAPSAEYVKILGQSKSDKDCETRSLPGFKILEPAQHGLLCYRDEDVAVAHAGVAADQHCVGKKRTSRVVYFRPKDHFVGTDSFRYEYSYKERVPEANVHAVVTLTAGASTAGTAPANEAQKAGRMPACPK
jgi:hypothetical protein